MYLMSNKITDKLLIIYVVSIYFFQNDGYVNFFVYGGFFAVLIFGLIFDYFRGG